MQFDRKKTRSMDGDSRDDQYKQDSQTKDDNINIQCGMRLKSDAPSYAAVPIVGLFSTQVMATVFMNAQVIFLLRTDTSNITEDQLGKKTSFTLTFQLIAQMVASVFAGYYYDVLGRRLMVAISYILIIAALIWTPYTATNLIQLCIARMILGVGVQIQLGNPLINDYIHTSSRGLGTVFQNAGWIVGETFAMAVLFNFTKGMELTASFHIAAATMGFFAIVMTSMIKTHISKSQRMR